MAAPYIETNCQVLGFMADPRDLCTHCGGDGEERPVECCAACPQCFDDEIGWSTGIDPGTLSLAGARRYVISQRRFDSQ